MLFLVVKQREHNFHKFGFNNMGKHGILTRIFRRLILATIILSFPNSTKIMIFFATVRNKQGSSYQVVLLRVATRLL